MDLSIFSNDNAISVPHSYWLQWRYLILPRSTSSLFLLFYFIKSHQGSKMCPTEFTGGVHSQSVHAMVLVRQVIPAEPPSQVRSGMHEISTGCEGVLRRQRTNFNWLKKCWVWSHIEFHFFIILLDFHFVKEDRVRGPSQHLIFFPLPDSAFGMSKFYQESKDA